MPTRLQFPAAESLSSPSAKEKSRHRPCGRGGQGKPDSGPPVGGRADARIVVVALAELRAMDADSLRLGPGRAHLLDAEAVFVLLVCRAWLAGERADDQAA